MTPSLTDRLLAGVFYFTLGAVLLVATAILAPWAWLFEMERRK